ncbi:hypothetical protein ACFQ0M_21365 [Kitasatospora aburaviensis]
MSSTDDRPTQARTGVPIAKHGAPVSEYDNVWLVIPAYNEGQVIAEVVEGHARPSPTSSWWTTAAPTTRRSTS